MRLPRIQLGVGQLMVAVLILALVAALVAQSVRTDRRVAELRAELRYLRTAPPGRDAGGAMVGIGRSKVMAAGDRVLVVAAAHMTDHRPNAEYVWWLRMYDPGRKRVVFSKRYDRELVRPPRGQVYTPTLADIIRPPLPPGEYVVEAALYMVPPDEGLAGLDGESSLSVMRSGFAVASMSGAVSLMRDEGPTKRPTAQSTPK